MRMLGCGAAGAAVCLLLLAAPTARADRCTVAEGPCTNDAQCCSDSCDEVTGRCACQRDGDCDDHDACTLDLCGPTTEMCHHVELGEACTACLDASACDGGACCAGRCCPEGASCMVGLDGIGRCCQSCGAGASEACCDALAVLGDGGFTAALAQCIGGDQALGNGAFCCPGGHGSWATEPETGEVLAACVLPAGYVP